MPAFAPLNMPTEALTVWSTTVHFLMLKWLVPDVSRGPRINLGDGPDPRMTLKES